MKDLDGYEVEGKGAVGNMPQLTERQLGYRRVGNIGAWAAAMVALYATFQVMESPGWLASLAVVLLVYNGLKFVVFVTFLRDVRSPNGWRGWRTREALAEGILR